MRAVLDTSILIRAILNPKGSVGRVLDALREDSYTYIYSFATLEELIGVLERPRMRHRYGVSSSDIEAICNLLTLRGEQVPVRNAIEVCRDPKDDKFLEVAIIGQANAIVTGDEDLLVLHPFEGIPIIEPAEFLRLLEAT